MDILGYKTSKAIDLIYQEILSLIPTMEIEWVEVKYITGSNAATGSCLVDHETGDAKICLTAKGKTDEDAISHEMLHALWFAKGYVDAQVIAQNCYEEYMGGQAINNLIQHTFILKRQIDMGILSVIQLKSRLAASYCPKGDESNIFSDYFADIINCFGADLISRKIYGEHMTSNAIKHSKIYTSAKRLTDMAEKYDLLTPFGQRRAIVAVYKELEKIAQENGIGLDLKNTIAVPCVFSERQLMQNTISLFDLNEYSSRRKKYIRYHFNLISDNQCCYAIHLAVSKNDTFLKLYEESVLEEFLSKTQFEYFLRQ